MKTKLIIVADLGHLRVFREVQPQKNFAPHLELMEEMMTVGAHEKVSEQVTDQAGRFSRGYGPANFARVMSAGERHNYQTEQDRRLMGDLVEQINQALRDPEVQSCLFAASAPIHKQLFGAIDPRLRTKIVQVLGSNLTKIDPKEIARHFEAAAA